METESLMINDLVHEWNNDHTETHIVTVEKPTREGVYDKFNHFHDADWIEPIPLTKEILEKNFDVEYNPSPYYYLNNRFTIKDFLKGDYMIKVITKWVDFPLFKIKFVHELQHALRLIGLTEMADNLKIE